MYECADHQEFDAENNQTLQNITTECGWDGQWTLTSLPSCRGIKEKNIKDFIYIEEFNHKLAIRGNFVLRILSKMVIKILFSAAIGCPEISMPPNATTGYSLSLANVSARTFTTSSGVELWPLGTKALFVCPNDETGNATFIEGGDENFMEMECGEDGTFGQWTENFFCYPKDGNR